MTMVYTWASTPEAVSHQVAILKSLLDALRSRLDSREPANRSLVSLLNSLACHLQMHFELEESDEYFGRLLREAPHSSGEIARLRAEHAALLSTVDEMIKQARTDFSNHVVPGSLRKDYRGFYQRFAEHETAERKLLQETYNVDIGSKD